MKKGEGTPLRSAAAFPSAEPETTEREMRRTPADPSRAKCCTKACNNDRTVIFFLRSAQKADRNICSDLWKIFDTAGREKAGGRKLQ